MNMLTHVDDYAAWLAAVVAGLAALGWLARRARDVARKIDRLDKLASLELTANGGGSMKDRVALVPKLDERLKRVESTLAAHLAKPTTTQVFVTGQPPSEGS